MKQTQYSDDGTGLLKGPDMVSSTAVALQMGEQHHAGSLAPAGAHQMYLRHRTTRTDKGWTIAFCVLAAVVTCSSWVVFPAGVKHIKAWNNLPAGYLNTSTSCSLDAYNAEFAQLHGASARRRLSDGDNDNNDSSIGYDAALGTVVVLSIVVGLLVAWAYLSLLRHRPEAMVKYSLLGTIVVLAIATVALFIIAWPLGIVCLVFTGIMAWVYRVVRPDLPLCAELIGAASRALGENLRIVPAILGTNVLMALAAIYLFSSITLAFNIVTPGPSRAVVARLPGANGTNTDIGVCHDAYGAVVPCCGAQIGAGPVVYIVVAFLFLSWMLNVVAQVRLAVVADLFSQWYYKPVGAFSDMPEANPSLRLAFRHALTTGFGTVTFAAFIVTILHLIRQAIRAATEKLPPWAACVINCIVALITTLLETFTYFASITAAITGKPLAASGRHMLQVFKQQFLKTANLWGVPGLVMNFTVLVICVVWGALVLGLGIAMDNGSGQSILLAFWSFVIVCVLISFTAGLVLDIVHTIYVCYVLDLSNRVVVRPELHKLYSEVVVRAGALVENPGGEMQYGAAEEGAAGPHMQQQPLQGASLAPAGASVQMSAPAQYPAPTAGYAQPYAPMQYAPYPGMYAPGPSKY